MKVLVKPKVTKPWSKEMYEYNDMVAELMKDEIKYAINRANDNDKKNTLNELLSICGGIKMNIHDFTQGEIWEACLEEIESVPNYWLDQEWDYAVKQGLVKDILYKMVGYGK